MSLLAYDSLDEPLSFPTDKNRKWSKRRTALFAFSVCGAFWSAVIICIRLVF